MSQPQSGSWASGIDGGQASPPATFQPAPPDRYQPAPGTPAPGAFQPAPAPPSTFQPAPDPLGTFQPAPGTPAPGAFQPAPAPPGTFQPAPGAAGTFQPAPGAAGPDASVFLPPPGASPPQPSPFQAVPGMPGPAAPPWGTPGVWVAPDERLQTAANWMGTLGLTLAAVGLGANLVLGAIFRGLIVLVAGSVLGIVGAMFARNGLKAAREGRASNRSTSLVGMILGYIAASVLMAGFLFMGLIGAMLFA